MTVCYSLLVLFISSEGLVTSVVKDILSRRIDVLFSFFPLEGGRKREPFNGLLKKVRFIGIREEK
jgi:hypothetical protein